MEEQHGQGLPSERQNLQAFEAIEQGIQYLENDEDDRAIGCFTEAIGLNPENARAYHLRGRMCSETGK